MFNEIHTSISRLQTALNVQEKGNFLLKANDLPKDKPVLALHPTTIESNVALLPLYVVGE